MSNYITYANGTWQDINRNLTYNLQIPHYHGYAWVNFLGQWTPFIITARIMLIIPIIKIIKWTNQPKTSPTQSLEAPT